MQLFIKNSLNFDRCANIYNEQFQSEKKNHCKNNLHDFYNMGLHRKIYVGDLCKPVGMHVYSNTSS